MDGESVFERVEDVRPGDVVEDVHRGEFIVFEHEEAAILGEEGNVRKPGGTRVTQSTNRDDDL